MTVIGVLALQGNFADHVTALECFDVKILEVRNESDLKQVDGLIIPGGESTAIGIIAKRNNFLQPLINYVKSGRYPVWGTCAGLITLANSVSGQAEDGKKAKYQPLIGGLNVTAQRNAFGRQSQSQIRSLTLSDSAKAAGISTNAAYFIRAPGIVSVSNGVEVLATLGADAKQIVAVRQGHLLATTFHSELGDNQSWTEYFLKLVLKTNGSLAQVKRSPQHPLPQVQGQGYRASTEVKRMFPRFLKGGVIMDVVNGVQAKIAEQSGACAVMALERIPADIRVSGGVARMSDPLLIKDVIANVTIPVMAKARIGHFGEARVLQELDVDCIDESEVAPSPSLINPYNPDNNNITLKNNTSVKIVKRIFKQLCSK